jgi:uroporphyrinogen-III synthase
LSSFTRPLAGKRIVVTRAADQAAELASLLAERGATPILYPCIAIAPPADLRPLRTAVGRLAAGEYAWLVLTSPNGVAVLADCLPAGQHRPDTAGTKLAVVGEATAEAARRLLGWTPDLIPGESEGEALAQALIEQLSPAGHILLCQAEIARPVLAERLTASGAIVDSLAVYRTVTGTGGEDLPALLLQQCVDAITLTSSSTAEGLLSRLAGAGVSVQALEAMLFACLGPVTASTARRLGLKVAVVPEPGRYTLEALVAALEAHYGSPGSDETLAPPVAPRAARKG